MIYFICVYLENNILKAFTFWLLFVNLCSRNIDKHYQKGVKEIES